MAGRGWKFWTFVVVAGLMAVGGIGNLTAKDERPAPAPTATAEADVVVPAAAPTTPEPTIEAPELLFVADQKDGDSFVASDGVEYRLGLVNTPERNEPCGSDATAFTRDFLASGFTVDAYSFDTYGRTVAEVFDADGDSLNVALAESGLGNDQYLEQFRSENPDLGSRLDEAFASAATPSCQTTNKPAPLVAQPKKTNCMEGYSPCIPIAADLNCPDIGFRVKVTGNDPYRLDRDGDGYGCE